MSLLLTSSPEGQKTMCNKCEVKTARERMLVHMELFPDDGADVMGDPELGELVVRISAEMAEVSTARDGSVIMFLPVGPIVELITKMVEAKTGRDMEEVAREKAMELIMGTDEWSSGE